MNLRAFCFATAVEAAAIKVIIKRKVVFFIFFLLFGQYTPVKKVTSSPKWMFVTLNPVE
jgi:hypothetical protein